MKILRKLVLHHGFSSDLSFVAFVSLNIVMVDLCEPKINDKPYLGFRIIEEVTRFDISMKDAYFLQTSKSYKKLNQIMFDVLHVQS